MSASMSMCDSARERGAAFAIWRLDAEGRENGEAGDCAGALTSESRMPRTLEQHMAMGSAVLVHRDDKCRDSFEAKQAGMGMQGKDAAQKLSEEEDSRCCWRLGKNLGQELFHRHECGREAHIGALNFRDSERRAQSRLFSQHKLSNPSRFYKEAARHPEGDIIDSMALALRRKVVLLDCNMIGVQKPC